ncbi:PEP-CTERM sorting domain-containing protein [bacterium]|nr:PEP-CTERM sorting domain-containing protein [bacterium]
MRTQRRTTMALAVIPLVLALATVAPAATYTWDTTDGIYSNTANWAPPGTTPGTTDTVVFDTNATYTVTFDRAENANYFLMTNSGTAIFDLGSNTFLAVQGSDAPVSFFWLGSNATDNVNLTISNGTMRSAFYYGTVGPAEIAANGGTASLTVQGAVGSPATMQFNGVNLRSNGTVVVTGPGAYMDALYGPFISYAGSSLIISNSACAKFTEPHFNGPVTVTGGTLTNSTGVGYNYNLPQGADINVLDGGSIITLGAFGAPIGYQAAVGSDATFTIGNGVGTSVFEAQRVYWNDAASQGGEMVVNNGGVVRVTGSGVAGGDLRVTSNGTLTLGGGTAEMSGGSSVVLANGPLRGTGLIKRYTGASKFSVANEGFIQPGDTSASPAIGTLSIENGDLFQTNAAALTAGLRFDFDPNVSGSADLIDITGGSATITAGSNVFNNISGATSIGFGTWDFLKADTILYTPGYDNLSNIVLGLTLPDAAILAGWSYGVVDLGSYDVLRLSISMVPEPSTILLLVGGGLLVWRARRRM